MTKQASKMHHHSGDETKNSCHVRNHR